MVKLLILGSDNATLNQAPIKVTTCLGENEGKIFFKADSDSTIVKGLIALLVRTLSGQTPEEILNAKLEFIEKIGLKQHLAQTRANGLAAMIKQMKMYALGYKLKQELKS